MIDSGTNNNSINDILTVKSFYERVENALSRDLLLGGFRIKGEVQSYKINRNQSTGKQHIYFNLIQKVSGSKGPLLIKCSWWDGKNRYNKDRTKIKDGDVVTIYGSIDVFDNSSTLTIIVNNLYTNDEKGEAKAEYERRRRELEAKGYFDEAHKKKEGPKYPKAIGIVTSATGDAIADIEHTVSKKNPYVQMYLYPVNVQGDGAAAGIVRAIKYFDGMVDIIIIGRGGGSAGDLTAFDDPAVVEAVYNCSTYLIAGTGHTPDRTLADFAADKIAITPTDAAFEAVFDVVSELEKLDIARRDLYRNITNIVSIYERVIDEHKLKIEKYNPFLMLENKNKDLENKFASMQSSMNRILNTRLSSLNVLSAGIYANSPAKLLDNRRIRYEQLSESIRNNMRILFDDKRKRFANEYDKLVAINPAKKLVGGFGYVQTDSGAVANVSDLSVGSEVSVKMHDGVFMAEVTKILEETGNG